MSTSEPKTETAQRPKRDPQALSSEYHKARKQLMFWAGILFIWELVGIDLEKAKEAGGNAGAVIIAIKSPQAVPWVLLILVAYFLFKTTIEWYQCSAARRSLRVSTIDFGSAWIASLLAYSLYIWQAVSRTQFADTLQDISFMQSLITGSLLGVGSAAFLDQRKNLKRLGLGWAIGMTLLATLGFVVSRVFSEKPGVAWQFFLGGFSAGFVLPLTIMLFWRRRSSWLSQRSHQRITIKD